MSPPFADMRTVQGAILSERLGYNPQYENPGDPWGRPMNYPMVWLFVAKTLSLEVELHFLLFVAAYVALFVVVLIWLLARYPSAWLLAACCSSATLLAVERGNNDIVIFVLLTIAFASRWGIVSSVGVLAACYLKLFPIAAACVLLRRPLLLLLTITFFLTYVAVSWSDVLGTLNGVPASAHLSYGTKSLAAICGYSIRWSVILAAHAALGVAVTVIFRSQFTSIFKGAREDVGFRLFLGGASIYVLTFAISSSWDYRLIFLILCIPWLADAQRSKRCSGFLIAILIAMCDYWLSPLGIVARVAVVTAKTAIFVVFFAILLTHVTELAHSLHLRRYLSRAK